MPLTDYEKGLFVGLLEGEGSLTIYKSTEKRKLGKRTRSRLGFTLGQKVCIHNTCRPLLERVQASIGGRITRSGKAKGSNLADKKRTKDMYVLRIGSKEHIVYLLEQVIDFLIDKRGRAEAMIAFCLSRINRPSLKAGYTQAEIDMAECWGQIANSPLTAKGRKIMAAMKSEYGAKKGEHVFYASKNKGTIKGVEGHRKKRRRVMG